MRLGAAIVDASPNPLLRVGQQHCEGMAVAVLEVDADRVAALVWEPHVGDDRTGADVIALADERGDTRVDDVDGERMLVAWVRSCRDHVGLSVSADGRRVGEELASGVKLVLGEAEDSVEQAVEVVLRSGEALSRQEVK